MMGMHGSEQFHSVQIQWHPRRSSHRRWWALLILLLPWLFVQLIPSAQWWRDWESQTALSATATAAAHYALPANAEGRVWRWWDDILIAAQQAKVPPILLAAIMLHESGGIPNAGSPSGAYGLMQLEPGTAQHLPGWYPGARANPGENLILGAELLAQNERATGNWLLATAAYYGGPGYVTPYVAYNASWPQASVALNIVPCPTGPYYASCYQANDGLTMTGYVDEVMSTMKQVATWQTELALPSNLPNFFPAAPALPAGVSANSLTGELDDILVEVGESALEALPLAA